MYYNSILLIFVFCLISCGKSTQKNASDSLIGEWKVSSVFEATSKIAGGSIVSETQTTYDGIGAFLFSSTTMDYEYISSYAFESIQNYTLDITIENSGFIRVNVFTINGEQENFRLRFGDETDDAHEEAQQISLEQEISSDSMSIFRLIELDKQ